MNDTDTSKAWFIAIVGIVYALCVAVAGYQAATLDPALLLALTGWAILIGIWIGERRDARLMAASRHRYSRIRLHAGL